MVYTVHDPLGSTSRVPYDSRHKAIVKAAELTRFYKMTRRRDFAMCVVVTDDKGKVVWRPGGNRWMRSS